MGPIKTNNTNTGRQFIKRMVEQVRQENSYVAQASTDTVEFSDPKDSDFQNKRLKAAISELLDRHPEPSPQRDPVLLRVLGRECRNSEEMEPFRHLLHTEDSQCHEVLHFNNGVAPGKHPHHGKNFEQLGEHLDLVEPVLELVQELAEPLPECYQNLYRRTSEEHHAKETADNKFDFEELFDRGFAEKHITGVYASNDPTTIIDFGSVEQELQLQPGASFIREGFGAPAEVQIALDQLGLEGHQPAYELYSKAGVDVCLYKDVTSTGSWFTILNPESIDSVS